MSNIDVQKVSKSEDRKLPIFEEAERMMQQIRDRAYALSAGRGDGNGSALNDWLSAERELCGSTTELLERDQNYSLNMAMAGFEPKDISVTATPRELIVSAKFQVTHGDSSKDKSDRVCWSEFQTHDVYRRVELPSDIQAAKVSATYENGLLKVVAPKVPSTSTNSNDAVVA